MAAFSCGGGAAPKNKETWYYGGFAAMAAAALLMLVTLRQRKQSRTARLLLFRADLKRLDDDRKGASEDLHELLRLTPWDDSAWAELSDDMAAGGDLPAALSAIREAAKIDPDYDEYHMLETSLCIRLKQTDEARTALSEWARSAGVRPDDSRLAIYQTALQLAEGDREAAEQTLKKILKDNGDDLDLLDDDQALADIKDLLPGRNL